MRAFLSHSSKNKVLVKKVFDDLGAALAEYDERTFESGRFNIPSIEAGLERSDLFVLFATHESLSSGYVEVEVNLAQEFLAQRKISKIIVFCSEGISPNDLPGILQSISAIRKVSSPGAIARYIRGSLTEMTVSIGKLSRPFVGRESLKDNISSKLSDPTKYTPVALALSGVDGVGRRTLAQKIFQDIYPYLSQVQPAIYVVSGAGLSDLFREFLLIGNELQKDEVYSAIVAFDKSSEIEKQSKIAIIIEQMAQQNQITYLIDDGGLLDDDGRLNGSLRPVFELLKQKNFPHPPLCLILFRTPPGKAREPEGVIYQKVEGLTSDDIKKIISLYLKKKNQLISATQLDSLVDLVDGHPYNLEYLIELMESGSLESIIEDPSDIIAFKKRQGDEFLSKIALSDNARQLLASLRVLGPSSVAVLARVSALDIPILSKSLKELEECHCIDRMGTLVGINRPLRAAIERSAALQLSKFQVQNLREQVIEIFNEFDDSDSVPVSLISTAARAAIMLNDQDAYLRMFISPANSVLAARQLYDVRRYSDCAQACQFSLQRSRLITRQAEVESTRLRCLSLIRLGRNSEFKSSVEAFKSNTDKETALKFFLEGFYERIRGYPASAVVLYKRSLSLNPTSFSALREISHSLLMQDLYFEAKSYTDKALEIAPTNPYVIDQALAILISQKKAIDDYVLYDPEIAGLLERLERYGDENGRSFYAIRMADLYRRMGKHDAALQSLDRAKELNPSHLPAYLMECDILLKDGATSNVIEKKLNAAKVLIDDVNSGEGKTNLPEFISLKIRSLMEARKLSDAIRLLMGSHGRLGAKAANIKRQLSFEASRSGSVISDVETAFLQGD